MFYLLSCKKYIFQLFICHQMAMEREAEQKRQQIEKRQEVDKHRVVSLGVK